MDTNVIKVLHGKILFTTEELEKTVFEDDQGNFKWRGKRDKEKPVNTTPFTDVMKHKLEQLLGIGDDDVMSVENSREAFKKSGKSEEATWRGWMICPHKVNISISCLYRLFKLGAPLEFDVRTKCVTCGKIEKFKAEIV
jgi:hypothetical protein